MCFMELTLDTPVRFVPRVGPAMATKLEILEIRCVRDFLYHIPFRYNDYSNITPVAQVRPDEIVTIKGTVERFNAFATKSGKRLQEAKVRDDSGVISVIWFNQPFLRSVIKEGMTIHLSGTVSWFGTKLVLNSPEYELFHQDSDEPSLHTGRIVPVYPATEGISSKWMRGRIALLLSTLLPTLIDPMPETLKQTYHLMGLSTALSTIHFPASMDTLAAARARLAFDELLSLQLRAYTQKRERETKEMAHHLALTGADIKTFWESLPFTLTADQEQAIGELLVDLKRAYPMNRLLVGDVGSGKTVVAAAAMYAAVRNNTQAVLMAPTQILAQQHFQTLSKVFAPLGIKIGLVTGAHKDAGHFDVIVGTHALLSDSTKFKKLSLVVIDEQHRFGVSQRTILMEKGSKKKTPHMLTMTATPIPRTVAKTAMGHMDLSILTVMPKGRTPIKTWVVSETKRQSAYGWITKQITETGGQAFVICPLIEESETMTSVRAVKKEFDVLKKIFFQFSVGLLHGRMKPKEKNEVLEAFRDKKHHILLATPVVEVGIDIPNATIMVIEASERFGLSQLHQLRGRVGRGSLASYCLLFTSGNDEAVERLKLLETEASGPDLAAADLERRGAGDIMGTRQHGIPNLKIATFGDTKRIEEVQEALVTLTTEDPDLKRFPLLRALAQNSTIERRID
jgi:ATP-dependent DNA helicase RecG